LATKIRLKRTGAKKQPQYRVIVIDERAPRDGRAIEEIGHHNPLTDPPTTVINEERARHWLSVGAQPSDTVASLLRRAGILAAKAYAPAADAAAAAPAVAAAVAVAEPVVEAPAVEAAPVAEAPAEEVVAEAPAVAEAEIAEAFVEEPAVEEAVAEAPAIEEPEAEQTE
jgi:small subunit ribosomal protein S16